LHENELVAFAPGHDEITSARRAARYAPQPR
jgi:hypothetical protein